MTEPTTQLVPPGTTRLDQPSAAPNQETQEMCSDETMEPVLEAFTAGVPAQEREEVGTDAFKACHEEYAELPDETDLPIRSDLPVLLLSGALDPATPASNAVEVLATLPNGFSFEFPYGGHVQFLTGNACAESIVASFIADPTTEPDGSCIAEALTLQFALPAEQ